MRPPLLSRYSTGLVRRIAGIRNTHAIATAAAPMSAPAKHTDPMPKAVLIAPPTAEPPPIPKLKNTRVNCRGDRRRLRRREAQYLRLVGHVE